jgi:putative spermidine/putrescine transport system permease protein
MRGALMLPLAIYLAVFVLWPMIQVTIMSFYKPDAVELWVRTFTLANYEKILSSPVYFSVLSRTLRVAVVTTLICIILGYPIAYFLVRTKSRLRGLYTLLVFFPLLVSVVIRSYGWIALLGDRGLVNSVWLSLPFADAPLPLMFHEYSVDIGLAEVLLPFMIVPLMSSLQNLDPAQEEAAIGLGAGPLRIFRELILPVTAPGLISGSLLVFTEGMSAFAIPMFLGGPRQTSMAVLIYQQMVFTFNWPLGSSVAILMLLVTFGAVILALVASARLVPVGLRL